jgi:hypothetical protein
VPNGPGVSASSLAGLEELIVSRHGFSAFLRQLERAERARQQTITRQNAANERAGRNAVRQTKADAKESERLYLSSRSEEADELTAAIRNRDEAIATLLIRAVKCDPAVDLGACFQDLTPEKKTVFMRQSAIWNMRRLHSTKMFMLVQKRFKKLNWLKAFA